jgi:uncharacterized protein (TIGR00369 family)
MTRFESPNPDYERDVRSSFALQGAMSLLGAEIAEIFPGRCLIRLPYRPELSQQQGYFHGGIISTIADTAGGYAAYSMMPAGSQTVTVEYKINFLAPALGSELLAFGVVLRPGRSLVITRMEVYVVKNDHRLLCAAGQQTMMRLEA